MNRYSNSEIFRRFDGKQVYRSVIYPPIPVDNADIYIVTNETMYLDSLAHTYYKDVSLWWIIAAANNLGKGRLSVPAGIQIRIPANVYVILEKYKELNK